VADKPYIGGQAVLEGVMMRSPLCLAVAVRRPDGEIAVREQPWRPIWRSWRVLRWPLLRGATTLVESVWNGYSALKWSALQAMPEEEREAQTKGGNAAVTISTLVALAIFIALPHGLAAGVGRVVPGGLPVESVAFHLVAGLFKLSILLGYLAAIRRIPEIRRVFQFHGAEHKAIYAYETEGTLSVERARAMPRLHPRCGTTFLIVVVAMSVIVFSVAFAFVPLPHVHPVLRHAVGILFKVPLLFPIAGLAYEFQRWTAKHYGNRLVRFLTQPGLWTQKITTIEPDDDQLEVALVAMATAIRRERVGEASAVGAERTFGSLEACLAADLPTAA
jgi:uncharacterized protein YqhQ